MCTPHARLLVLSPGVALHQLLLMALRIDVIDPILSKVDYVSNGQRCPNLGLATTKFILLYFDKPPWQHPSFRSD